MQIDDLLNLVFFAAVNVLARVVMKGVANCDTHCELRDSVNQQTVERMRCLGVMLRRSWIGVLISLYLVQYIWEWLSCVPKGGFAVNPWHINIELSDSHTFCGVDFSSL